MKLILAILALLCLALSVSPPVYDYAFHITFD
jgi:hypothetical protein